jgi:hypothetical protein
MTKPAMSESEGKAGTWRYGLVRLLLAILAGAGLLYCWHVYDWLTKERLKKDIEKAVAKEFSERENERHDKEMKECEDRVAKLDADLAKLEKELETETGGDPSRASSPEAQRIGKAINDIYEKTSSERFRLAPEFVSEGRRKAHEDRIMAVRNRSAEVLRRYDFPHNPYLLP